MDSFDVSVDSIGIDFGASGMKEIIQNVQTILTTSIGSVPLDRAFGIDLSPLDAPTTFTKAELAPIIIEAIHSYEPRVNVESVTFQETDQGTLLPIVRLSLAEGVVL